MELSDGRKWALAQSGMSFPVTLFEAIRTKPFIYCRSYGLFYVECGSHQIAASLLLSWENGFEDIVETMNHFNMNSLSELSEKWLEVAPGALVLSSVSNIPYASSMDNLNFQEKRFFKKITYLNE